MAARREVLIDDTHPSIRYEGAWQEIDGRQYDDIGERGRVFKSGLRVLDGKGSFTYVFDGSDGEIRFTNTVLGDLPPLEGCYLDGAPVAVPQSAGRVPENNSDFCAWNVASGRHVLTFNISNPSQRLNNLQPFLFDYIRFLPSSRQRTDNETLRVPASDPAVVPNPFWRLSDDELESRPGGGEPIVTFTFDGTGIQGIGYIPAIDMLPTTVTYSVDGKNPSSFDIQKPPTQTSLTNQHLFEIQGLSPGPHSINIKYTGNNDTLPLTLQAFIIFNDADSSVPAPSSTSPSTSPESPSSALSAGAIVGIVIGGLALLSLGGFLAWRIFILHRHRLQNDADREKVTPLSSGPGPASATGTQALKSHTTTSADLPPPTSSIAGSKARSGVTTTSNSSGGPSSSRSTTTRSHVAAPWSSVVEHPPLYTAT